MAGNGRSTARCIRPDGKRGILIVGTVCGPSKQKSLNIKEWLQPRNMPPPA